MPEATANHTIVPTRRRFLSQAAAVAAGGSILALATCQPAPAIAAPMAALASSEADPIFALIEEYRVAAETFAAAASEHDRQEEVLIEQGHASHPFVTVLDVSRPGRPQPIVAYKHESIDCFIPADRFSEPNAAAHAALDAQIERHKAIVGDSEKVMYAAMDAETEALDMLVWTPPTTVAGILALLEMGPVLRQARIDDDRTDAMMISVIDALRALHPNEAAIDTAAAQS